jgi:hypothetical protein
VSWLFTNESGLVWCSCVRCLQACGDVVAREQSLLGREERER